MYGLASLLFAATLPSIASAKTCNEGCSSALYTVDSNLDSPDVVIDGQCKSVAGGCTLRAAITEANATPCDDGINFTNSGKITLQLIGVEDANSGGDLDVELCPNESLVIVGNGADTTQIDADQLDRVLDVHNSSKNGAGILELRHLLLENGDTSLNGGGIRLATDAMLVLEAVAIEGSHADGDGGGIYAPGNQVSLGNSTLAHNTTANDGGGMWLKGEKFKLVNSTISSNEAERGGGLFYEGTDVDPSESVVNAATLTENSAVEGGGVYISSVLELENSILADNAAAVGPDCATSGSGVVNFWYTYYTILTPACTNNIGVYLTQSSPNLDALGYHGGEIRAHCPSSGSPVIGAADPLTAPGVDQYGTGRDAQPDMGSCEF